MFLQSIYYPTNELPLHHEVHILDNTLTVKVRNWSMLLAAWTFRGKCIVIYYYNYKPTRCTLSQLYFDKELYMSRTDLLSVIRSLNTVFTPTGICYTVMLTVC